MNLATASGQWCSMVQACPDRKHEVLNHGPAKEVCFCLLKVFWLLICFRARIWSHAQSVNVFYCFLGLDIAEAEPALLPFCQRAERFAGRQHIMDLVGLTWSRWSKVKTMYSDKTLQTQRHGQAEVYYSGAEWYSQSRTHARDADQSQDLNPNI